MNSRYTQTSSEGSMGPTLLLSPGHPLLNFYMRPFSIAVPLFGIPLMRVDSVEHYFQAMKVFYIRVPHSLDQLSLFQEVINSSTPNGAKRLGRILPLNSTLWDRASLGHMVEGQIAKFHQHSDLREQLLVTDGRHLIEHSRDAWWGDGLGGGRNFAGQALELVRELLINSPA